MTGGHDTQPCQILQAVGKTAKVRQKLSDWDLDCSDNIELKENFGDFSHLSWNRSSDQNGIESTNAILEKSQLPRYKVVCASSRIQSKMNGPQRQSTKESSSSEDDDDDDDNDVETPMCLEKSVLESWNRSSDQNGIESTNAVLEKTQLPRYKVVCASSRIQRKIHGPQRQSTKESSSSEDDDDETDNDVETPMCLEKSVENQMCLEKAQNNFPFCALSDTKHRSAFKDFEWSSDEESPVKYILPTKFKTVGKTARKSISTANSKREVIFQGSQETLPNKITRRSPSVKTKLKISRGDMLTKSILQSHHEGSSNRSFPHKKPLLDKLVITKQNNRYTAVPVVQSCSKKPAGVKFRIENFIKKIRHQ